MASVISSARTSTASIFDTVTQATGLIADTIGSASKGMDILHSKVDTMHAAATQNLDVKKRLAKEADLESLVINHSEAMVELGKRMERNPKVQELYAKTMALLENKE